MCSNSHIRIFIDERAGLEELYDSFEEFKRERHMLTYDDLLVRLREALEASAELRERLSDQYRYIMVDEYQDTNRLQAQIVRLLTAKHDNVAVVGDECQSIYSFPRGELSKHAGVPRALSRPRRSLSWKRIFAARSRFSTWRMPSSQTSKRVTRSACFHRIEGEGQPPVAVSARDENEQSRFRRAAHRRVTGWRRAALRDRRAVSRQFALVRLEIELGKHGIPFRKFGGIKFAGSRLTSKTRSAFLRLVSNPSDTLSWFRALKLIDHIGDATVNQILDHLGVERKEFRAARTKESLFKKLHRFPARAGYKDQLSKLARLLLSLVETKSPGAQLSTVLRFYRPILKGRYDDYPRRGRDLEHLQTIAKRYKSAAELLADVALDPSDAAQSGRAARGGGVTLSTVHSAKGLEWEALFVIWMTDGWFPSVRSADELDDLEEERRLLYVAATRAKRHLYFVYPLHAYRGGDGDSFPVVSRFLEAIPHTILPHASLSGGDGD